MSNLSSYHVGDKNIRNFYHTVVFDSSTEKNQLGLDQSADQISSEIQQRIDTFASDFTVKIWVIDIIDVQDEDDVDDSEIGCLFFSKGKLSIDFTELELNEYEAEPLTMRILRRVNLPVTHLRVNSENLIAIVEIWKVKLSEILSDVTQVTYTDEQLFFDSSHRIISDFTKQLKKINCEDHGTLTPTVVGRHTPYPNVEQFDGVIDECDLSTWQKIFPKVTHFEMSLPSC